ncbi:hypothetical protein [Methylobacterium sp. B1]|uniref:hypothetical protein n=1 Tax=Methylobacterium sp. B1 TaxID=91459 RepID=UPI0016518B7C|nr:hypothetical protein [Methylobacterium sp. B1]
MLAVGRRAVEQAHLSAPNIPVEQLAQYQLDAIETAQREDGQMGDDRCRTALESYRHVEDLFTAVR